MSKLTIFGDMMSQPVRSVISFCKLNKINYEFQFINLAKKQNLSEEFKLLNIHSYVPVIKQTEPNRKDFILYESHSILRFLSSFYKTNETWYPNRNLYRKAKIDEYLDYHHINTRFILMNKFRETISKQTKNTGRKFYLVEDEKLDNLLEKFESTLGKQKYIIDDKISIADLSLTSELNQFFILSYNFDKYNNLCNYLKSMNEPEEMKEVNDVLRRYSEKVFNFKMK